MNELVAEIKIGIKTFLSEYHYKERWKEPLPTWDQLNVDDFKSYLHDKSDYEPYFKKKAAKPDEIVLKAFDAEVLASIAAVKESKSKGSKGQEAKLSVKNSDGFSLLEKAVLYGSLPAVWELMGEGADPHFSEPTGRSAFSLAAAELENSQMTDLLQFPVPTDFSKRAPGVIVDQKFIKSQFVELLKGKGLKELTLSKEGVQFLYECLLQQSSLQVVLESYPLHSLLALSVNRISSSKVQVTLLSDQYQVIELGEFVIQ